MILIAIIQLPMSMSALIRLEELLDALTTLTVRAVDLNLVQNQVVTPHVRDDAEFAL